MASPLGASDVPAKESLIIGCSDALATSMGTDSACERAEKGDPPCSWPSGRFLGRFRAGWRYAVTPVRVTARARISQFAEANSMCRWLRFLPIPR